MQRGIDFSNFECRLLKSLPRSRLVLMLAGCFVSTHFFACQSSTTRSSEIAVKESTVDLQFSSDGESLLTGGSRENAIKARNELLKGTKPNSAQSDAGKGNASDGGYDINSDLLISISELSLVGADYTKAREIARSRLKKNYNDITAMNLLIRASLMEGKTKEASLLVDNALQIEPRNATTLNLKGLTLYQENRLIEAREVWKLAQKYDPTHVPSMMNLAALYFVNRNITLAGALFERIIALQPGHLDARVGFALVRYAQGDADQGRALLNKIYEMKPSSPLVLYNLAVLERDGFQNYPKALTFMEKFVESASKVSSARKAVETGLVQISALRSKIAAQNEKLSDADLRSLASSPGSENASPQADVATKKAQAEGSGHAPESEASQLIDSDVQSLEDRIK